MSKNQEEKKAATAKDYTTSPQAMEAQEKFTTGDNPFDDHLKMSEVRKSSSNQPDLTSSSK